MHAQCDWSGTVSVGFPALLWKPQGRTYTKKKKYNTTTTPVSTAKDDKKVGQIQNLTRHLFPKITDKSIRVIHLYVTKEILVTQKDPIFSKLGEVPCKKYILRSAPVTLSY